MSRAALAIAATALLAAACGPSASEELGSQSKSATIATVRTVQAQPAAPAGADFTDLGQRQDPPAGSAKAPSPSIRPAPQAPRSGSQLTPARPPAADPCNRPAMTGKPGIMLPACSSG